MDQPASCSNLYDDGHFSIEGLGETTPAFATADGVEDIRNRRTEAEVTLSIEPEFPSIETATR